MKALRTAGDPTKVWNLLSSQIDHVPNAPPRLAFANSRRYRLLDVLVARVLTLILPDFYWTVTPGPGSVGIDLQGEFPLFDIPELSVRGRELIIARCTRHRSTSKRYHLSSETWGVLGQSEPAHLILVVPSSVNPILRRQVITAYQKTERRTLVLFSRPELEYLIHYCLPDLEGIIREHVLHEDAELLLEYFQSPMAPIAAEPSLEVHIPQKGETGKPFLVYITIHPPLPVCSLTLHWKWPELIDPQLLKPATSVQLISPSAACQDSGLRLAYTNSLEIPLRFKFRSFKPGRQSLGSILLYSDDGNIREELELGEIEILDQYHPPFFRAPYMASLNAFDDLLRQTGGGHLHVVTITGSGGSGKTRLCEEFGFNAEQLGFRWVTRPHPNHQDQPYKLFGDLFRSLIPEPPSTERPSDVVGRYLASLNPSLAEAASTLLGLIYPYGRVSRSSEGLSKELLLRVFLTLLIDQSNRNPLCIHLSDLHWANANIFLVLAETIDRMRELEPGTATRIMFLLEGRIGEALSEKENNTDYNHAAAAAWELFLERSQSQSIMVKPLTRSQSGGFLQQLFENTESQGRRVPKSLIPHQQELIQAILRLGEGNPFHMIEQIKLLRHHRIIEQNARTGLLFLSQPVPSSLEVPADVRSLILRRFEYLQVNYNGIAALIRAVALIGDSVNGILFDKLRSVLCPDVSLGLISESEFLSMPRHVLGEVRFRHENYYQILREHDVLERDRVVNIYQGWLASQEDSPEVLFQKGLVAANGSQPNLESIRRFFVQSLNLLESDKKYPLSVRVLEHLVKLFPESPQDLAMLKPDLLCEFINFHAMLAKRITWTGDWEYALILYQELISIIETLSENGYGLPQGISRERLSYDLCSGQVELANVEIHQFRYLSAIQRLETIILEINVASRGDGSAQDWHSLFIRATNRLAVALWFKGDIARSVTTLRKALRTARRVADVLQESLQLRDLGTARVHINAAGGARMLGHSLALLKEVKHLPRQEYIATYQEMMANLVSSDRQSQEACITCARGILPSLEEVYVKARREGYINEEAGSSLLAGICHALIGSSDAVRWLTRSISTPHRGGLLEFLWKSHLNVAQLCIAEGRAAWEGAGLHAQQAQKLLSLVLARNDSSIAEFLKLPLAHIIRIWETLGDNRGRELAAAFPGATRLLRPGEPARLIRQRHNAQQPLHVGNGDMDLFFLN